MTERFVHPRTPFRTIRIRTRRPITIQFYENRNPSIHRHGNNLNFEVERMYFTTPRGDDITLPASKEAVYHAIHRNMGFFQSVRLLNATVGHLRFEDGATIGGLGVRLIIFEFMTSSSHANGSRMLDMARGYR